MRASDIPARDRLLAKLEPQPNGCWYWTGVIDDQGYGRVGYKGRRSTPLQQASYEEFVGPIPEGSHIDHACHSQDSSCPGGRACMHRRCGNPAHLEAVDPAENARRAFGGPRRLTHCKHGHEYTPSNTYLRKCDGKRLCVTCYEGRYGHPPVKAVCDVVA